MEHSDQIERSYQSEMKVKEMEVKALKLAILSFTQLAFQCAGQTPKKEDVSLIVREICKVLQRYYRGLSIEEIREIFDQGVRGEYGDYKGINVVSISRWIKAYIHHPDTILRKQRELGKQKQRLRLAKTCSISDEEKESIMLAAYRKSITDYRSGKPVVDRCNAIYDWLDQKKLIKLTIAQKNELMQKAKKIVLARQKDTGYSNFTIQQIIKRISEAVTPDPLVVQEAKRLALVEHIKSLK